MANTPAPAVPNSVSLAGRALGCPGGEEILKQLQAGEDETLKQLAAAVLVYWNAYANSKGKD